MEQSCLMVLSDSSEFYAWLWISSLLVKIKVWLIWAKPNRWLCCMLLGIPLLFNSHIVLNKNVIIKTKCKLFVMAGKIKEKPVSPFQKMTYIRHSILIIHFYFSLKSPLISRFLQTLSYLTTIILNPHK